MAIDIIAPPGKLVKYVEIEITDEGTKPHVEFSTSAIRTDDNQMYDLPAEYKKRGVYGYVGFGYGGVSNPDGSTDLPFWQEARFINWGRSIFYPPERVSTENVRIWMRFLIYANIHVEYEAKTDILLPTWHFIAPP